MTLLSPYLEIFSYPHMHLLAKRVVRSMRAICAFDCPCHIGQCAITTLQKRTWTGILMCTMCLLCARVFVRLFAGLLSRRSRRSLRRKCTHTHTNTHAGSAIRHHLVLPYERTCNACGTCVHVHTVCMCRFLLMLSQCSVARAQKKNPMVSHIERKCSRARFT